MNTSREEDVLMRNKLKFISYNKFETIHSIYLCHNDLNINNGQQSIWSHHSTLIQETKLLNCILTAT